MPTGITVDFTQLRHFIDIRRQQLSDTATKDRLKRAADAYVAVLRAEIRSKVSPRASRNMENALCTIVGPWKTARGWAIGVGDIALVGLPSQGPKSRSTIREFWDWINKAIEKGEPEAVGAQQQAVKAEAARAKARRERRRVAQRRREVVGEIRARQAAEEARPSDLGKRIKERWDEMKRLGPTAPSVSAARIDAARAERASLAQHALGIRQRIRRITGTDGASILAKRALRAQLLLVRRAMKRLRESR